MKDVFESQRIENGMVDNILRWIYFLNNRHSKILPVYKNQLNNPPAYEILETCK